MILIRTTKKTESITNQKPQQWDYVQLSTPMLLHRIFLLKVAHQCTSSLQINSGFVTARARELLAYFDSGILSLLVQRLEPRNLFPIANPIESRPLNQCESKYTFMNKSITNAFDLA